MRWMDDISSVLLTAARLFISVKCISHNSFAIYFTQQTLGDEHLLCCSGSQTATATTHSTSTSKAYNDNESLMSEESCKNMERSGDVEEGNDDVVFVHNRGDMAQAQDSKSTAAAAADDAVKYTHISLPLPGCDVTGKSHICSTETAKESRQEVKGKRWKLPSLFQFQTGKNDGSGREVSQAQAQTESVSAANKLNRQHQTDEKRSVPIFCAVCLSEFAEGDRVCWSSNADCSHVFHENCILQWLTSSGKKRSMSQFFTRNPSDDELLKNEFCPCCRQEFICVKQALLGSEESV